MYSNSSSTTYYKMFLTATKRGSAKRRNKHCALDGEYRIRPTFFGPEHVVEGVFTASYHDTKILTVDFTNQRLTHHGWANYSPSTNMNLAGWMTVLASMQPARNATPWLYVPWRYRCWLDLRDMWPGNASVDKRSMRAAFLTQRDWVQDGWFHWGNYNEDDWVVFREGLADLATDQQWRYFTYDWNGNGHWARRFIDASAEKKWDQREKRRRGK